MVELEADGLQARLRLGVDLRALGLILQEAQPPSELHFDQSPATGLDLEDLGCSTRWHNFNVLPFEPASYVIEAHASNAFDSRKLYLEVRDVARTSSQRIGVLARVSPHINWGRDQFEFGSRVFYEVPPLAVHIDVGLEARAP